MTATRQPETKSPSRRALLAGALGGLGALAAGAIGRASPVHAADGDPVLLGFVNTATQETVVGNSSGGHGLSGQASGTGIGLDGWGVSGFGVRGVSNADAGVYGLSYGDNSTAGVWGNSLGAVPGVGVRGSTASSTAVYGFCGTGSIPLPPNNVGVYGRSSAGHGVHGKTDSGFAGYFEGKVYTSKFVEMPEVTAPAAPGGNKARLFVRDDGSGHTQLCVRFNTGGVKVLATQT
jgi:hypothetical protein